MTRYTTHAQAEADAALITGAPFGLGWLARHLRSVVADPRSGSDVLLLVADALRASAATPDATLHAVHAILAWANTLATLAPTRADPIESDA